MTCHRAPTTRSNQGVGSRRVRRAGPKALSAGPATWGSEQVQGRCWMNGVIS